MTSTAKDRSSLASKRTETFLSAGKVLVESSVRREYRTALAPVSASWGAASQGNHRHLQRRHDVLAALAV